MICTKVFGNLLLIHMFRYCKLAFNFKQIHAIIAWPIDYYTISPYVISESVAYILKALVSVLGTACAKDKNFS